jgi:hypothetical protein
MATCNLILDTSGVVRRMHMAKPAIYCIAFLHEFGIVTQRGADRGYDAIVRWAAKAAIVKAVHV